MKAKFKVPENVKQAHLFHRLALLPGLSYAHVTEWETGSGRLLAQGGTAVAIQGSSTDNTQVCVTWRHVCHPLDSASWAIHVHVQDAHHVVLNPHGLL